MNCLIFKTPPPFRLDSDDAKLAHIRKVLKLSEGGEVFAGQADGKLYVCSLSSKGVGGATLFPIREIKNPARANVSLAVAFARPQIAQRLLFEAACFGAENLVFYAAAKGEADYLKSGLYAGGEYEKWLEKGAEQSCSTFIPKFRMAESLLQALEILSEVAPSNALKIAPDVYEATEGISSCLCRSDSPHTVAVLGGERGFADADRILLRGKGYVLVSLGERVLRTDSAAIATLAAVSLCGRANATL